MGRDYGQGLAWKVAKAVMLWGFDTGTGNERRLWTDLIKETCRVRTFVPGYNTVVTWPKSSSFHARLLISPQMHK